MLSASDQLAVLDLLARANRAADEKDVEATLPLYADGGSIAGDMQASAENFAEDLQQVYGGEPGLKRHIGTGHIFRKAGDDRVVVDSLLTVMDGEAVPPTVVATADIRDECVRENGEWRVLVHTVTMDPGTRKAMSQE